MMAGLKLKDVRKAYGSVEVIHGVDLEIERGEFIVFVGPSGCGKSTLLRMIAGLEDISGGELYIEDRLVNEVPPSQRGIAMVFQTYALYPHMTVYDNMAFGMRIAKASREEIEKRIQEAASMLQLEPYLDRLPKALSGGQRQRVAIGRAICRHPDVFLFDEPLSNLDAALRVATRIEIARLSESMANTTMIYVTHDQVEAMTLADRIVVLSAGHIEQVGPPIELYENPANLFVAQFIGSPAMNIVPGKVTGTGDKTAIRTDAGSECELPIASKVTLKGTKVRLGVRPEDLKLARGKNWIIEGKVALVEKLGEVTQAYIEVADSHGPLIAKFPGTHNFKRDSTIRLAAESKKMHAFDENGISLKYLQ
jgi:alpha-glucoside transport system ATP-binding protein